MPNIVDAAIGAGKFNTLVAAVKAAGLVETLKSPGPFTVFAPTDEAFAKLPKGVVQALLSNPEALKALLTYHVVAGKHNWTELKKQKSIETVFGWRVQLDHTKGATKVDGATIVQADIAVDNGICHAIDAVIGLGVLSPPKIPGDTACLLVYTHK